MRELAQMSSFMPHGMCYLWKSWLIALHVISNGIIALSYFSIPIILLYILDKRDDVPFNGIFLLFSAFILCCGIGHAFDIWTLWYPNYRASSIIRLLTAIVSGATAIVLALKISQILTIPSPKQVNIINQQLEAKIEELEQQKIVIDQQEKFLRNIYNNVCEAIFVVDIKPDKRFYYQGFNPTAQKLIGTKEVVNKTPSQIFPPEVAAAVEHHYQECLTSKTTISYEECLPSQGEDTWWLTSLNPIEDETGNLTRIIGIALNITERKQAEQSLARLNEELEDRVRQRTAQLEHLNAILLTTTAQLEQRNQELDQFAYITSHDLKAPLRAIANLAEWIEEDLTDKLNDDTRHNMNLLRNRVQRLEKMINGLLNYSRVGRLKYEPELVDVNQMIADIIDSLDVNPHFQIEIQPDLPIFVTELIPLQQVFNNLISNAIRHSDCPQGRIVISVEEQEYFYEFLVSDNGKGIEPQYHERIFTIFQTLETRDTKESTGIGLAIVKKAIKSQGGKIMVESQVGQGTTFKFTWSKARRI
ncbi:MAG: ATP-binding protein [Cyanobacteria bacterium P01_A01_bin.83]